MNIVILLLLLAFQAKHLGADYFWQTPYMYKNKGSAVGYIKPLALHSAIHAGITALILSVYLLPNTLPEISFILAATLLDFTTHFTIDRWKAKLKYTPNESRFWEALGVDQFLHHFVGLIIVYFAVITAAV